jgi:hypothetical protein
MPKAGQGTSPPTEPISLAIAERPPNTPVPSSDDVE